jgi:hypothetical protein
MVRMGEIGLMLLHQKLWNVVGIPGVLPHSGCIAVRLAQTGSPFLVLRSIHPQVLRLFDLSPDWIEVQ